MDEQHGRLARLVKEALQLSDQLDMMMASIALNAALVALDGIGDAGPAAAVSVANADRADGCGIGAADPYAIRVIPLRRAY